MIYKYEQCVAYICPLCSKISTETINIFNFSGMQAIELCCSDEACLEAAVVIYPHKEKFKISVDCAICGEKHFFDVKKSSFWNKDLLIFSCPEIHEAGTLFIGSKEKVENAVSQLQSAPSEYDNILYGIATHLNSLLYSGRIRCSCGCCDIIPTTTDNRIVLVCADCEKQLSIEVNEKNFEKILASSDLII